MRMMNKDDFLRKSAGTLADIYDMLEKLPAVRLKDLPAGNTALVMVDMVNGFTREGALKSPRIEELIAGIAELSKACERLHISKLAFADCHTWASPEFGAYPPHCLAGTSESEIVTEIKETGGLRLIAKNSTNGFLEEAFREWLGENDGIDTFIITGDCTDICIQQFAITLKAWFNMRDRKSRVIVPLDAVETYDLGTHDAGLLNVMALYGMMINGVEVVRKVEYDK